MAQTQAASGGGGFVVEPGTLQAAAEALGGLGGELAALAKAPAINTGSLGAGSLEGTLHDFFSEWAYSVSQLEGHLTNVINNMQAAAVQYSKSEGLVANGAQW